MPIECLISVNSLRQAAEQISFDREEHAATDFVDIVVSGGSAIFRSVGTEAPASVEVRSAGSASVPFLVLDQIASSLKTFKKKDVLLRCEKGFISVDNFRIRSEKIELDQVAEPGSEVSPNASAREILAFVKARRGHSVSRGMGGRIIKAIETRRSTVAAAAAVLLEFGVTEQQLHGLVEAQIVEFAKRIPKTPEAA